MHGVSPEITNNSDSKIEKVIKNIKTFFLPHLKDKPSF